MGEWILITDDTVIPNTMQGILCLYKGLHGRTLIEAYVRGEDGLFSWHLTNNTFHHTPYKYYCEIESEKFPLPELE